MSRWRLVSILVFIVESLSVSAAASHGSDEPSSAAASPIKTLPVEGTTLHYVARGSGPLLLLVHGSMGELSDWDADASALSSKSRVIAYSRRFHHPNAPPKLGQPYSMQQHAADLAALIRANGGQANVVAHSYGAYTSLYMALHYPDLVRTLVLAEPPILPWLTQSPEGRAALERFQGAALIPARNAFLRGDMVDGMRQFINGVSGHAVFDQLPAQAKADIMRAAPEMRAELTTSPSVYMPAISCSQVHRFNHPVLIITGENSPAFFHIIAERLRRCLPHAEAVSIKGVSHGGIISPPAFTAIVQGFLRRHEADAGRDLSKRPPR